MSAQPMGVHADRADARGRIDAVEDAAPGIRALVTRLTEVAVRGLASMGYRGGPEVPHTLRGLPSSAGPVAVPQGTSLRYAAIAALGLAARDLETQEAVFGGQSAADVASECLAGAARPGTEPGGVALALWAAGELRGETDPFLVGRLTDAVLEPGVPTVTCAWALTAALAVPHGGDRLAGIAAERLLAAQWPAGTYPHTIPGGTGLRGHIGSFADQVYPVQALSRLAARTGEDRYLAAANATAARLVRLQGPAGQWWWHYDVRTGGVVEGYPVYSVHQHAMAPMVLLELLGAGGDDHRAAVAKGLHWLEAHPECVEPLIADELGVVWRKVGRREPPRASRSLAAISSRVHPKLRVPGLSKLLPPGVVDHECRPYELGWLMYAWAAPKEEQ